MKALASTPVAILAKVALGVSLAAAATGAAFAAWIDSGPEIFLSLVEAGMSWCF